MANEAPTSQPPEAQPPRQAGPPSQPDIDPGRDNAERLQSRAYESDFAALPASELEGTIARPGPVGSGIDQTSLPLVAVAVGCVLVLLGIFFASFVVLGLGLLVFLVGVVWRVVSGRFRR